MRPYLVLAQEVTGATHVAELPQLASPHLRCATWPERCVSRSSAGETDPVGVPGDRSEQQDSARQGEKTN